MHFTAIWGHCVTKPLASTSFSVAQMTITQTDYICNTLPSLVYCVLVCVCVYVVLAEGDQSVSKLMFLHQRMRHRTGASLVAGSYSGETVEVGGGAVGGCEWCVYG